MTAPKIRNVAIIAHVDHGKTTLVDAMLRQTGVFKAHQAVDERVMDTGDLEKERGITILAKNASIVYEGTKINIIDTPGHADFGGEVERTLRMADGAILLVDAAEGPLPQTRFVLSKALELGMPIIVVINKIDRQDARPDDVLTETFDLFCNLEASDEQTDFGTLYAVGKDGVASLTLDDRGTDLDPMFKMIMDKVPAPKADNEGPVQFLVHNIEHDDYVGRLAIGRVYRGKLDTGTRVALLADGKETEGNVGTIFAFESVERTKIQTAIAGDLVCFSGFEDVQIGDTFTHPAHRDALERIVVEQPTIKLTMKVNDSPYAGLSGKWVTSRHIRDRLMKEGRRNIAMKVEATDLPDTYTVYGRGELMLSVLAETMRREGFEFALGMPEVVTKEIDGVVMEPLERVVIDTPEEYVGTITTSLGERGGRMDKMVGLGHGRTRLEFIISARGLIGFRPVFLTQTRGMGLLSTISEGWEKQSTDLLRRRNGAIVSDRKGTTTPYALFHLEPRGTLFVGASTDVYEGMVVGMFNRPNDLDVNVCREKKLTNIRSANKDENVVLTTPHLQTIETAMEYIDADELIEVTPDAVRIRKRILPGNIRPKRREG